MKIALFDLDNCISDDNWRLPLIFQDSHSKIDKYQLYHIMAVMDRLCNFHVLKKFERIAFSTGRPDRYREETRMWLAKFGAQDCPLFMREDDGSTIAVKMKSLHRVLDQGHTIERAFDDRRDVIALYERYHIPTTRLYIKDREEIYG